jgi:hypothetical protein
MRVEHVKGGQAIVGNVGTRSGCWEFGGGKAAVRYCSSAKAFQLA